MRDRAKRLRGCSCPSQADQLTSGSYRQRLCYRGNCTEWRCWSCDGMLAGFGPIWCPCDGGCDREFKHPGMAPRFTLTEDFERVYYHVPVKPSLARRHPGRRIPSRKPQKARRSSA